MAAERDVKVRISLTAEARQAQDALRGTAAAARQAARTGTMPGPAAAGTPPVSDVSTAAAAPARREAAAIAAVTRELVNQKTALDRLEAATRPEQIERRVKMQLRLEEAQKRYNEALAAERQRQQPQGLLARLGGMAGMLPGLGGLLGGGAGAARGQAGGGLLGLMNVGGGAAIGAGGPAGAILAAAGAMKGLAQQALALAQAANPAAANRYQLAWADLQAVIGQRFVPVLEIATDAVRMIGDVLTNILPSGREFREALAPIKAALAEVKAGLMELAPAVKDLLVGALRTTAFWIQVAARQFTLLFNVLKNSPLGWLAGAWDRGREQKSSVGAAAAPAQIGAVEDLGRRIAESAFGAGIQQDDPQKQAVSWLEKIHQAVEKIAGLMGGAEKVKEAGVKAAGSGAFGVGGAVLDPRVRRWLHF